MVGGGITGLAAAWELSRTLNAPGALGMLGERPEIVVVEATGAVGGKLRTATVGGHELDVGAESMLARRPEPLELISDAGLAESVVHPRDVSPGVWSRGRRWPLPPGTLMGVPSDPGSALGLLTAPEVDRLAHEQLLPPPTQDLSVGDFVEARLGAAVVDRLVEPLLAGVYAGHARRLSLQATVPALWAASQRGVGVVQAAADAARVATALGAGGRPPVFAGYRGGLGRLVADLASRLGAEGVTVRTSTTVRELRGTPQGWELLTGPTTEPTRLDVDAVVLALPPAPTARLVGPFAPQAGERLGAIELASVGVVTLALPRPTNRAGQGRSESGTAGALASLAASSGFLVPPTEPVSIKAATFNSSKWPWVDDLDPSLFYLRVSIGRAGEAAVLQRDDADLVELALADLETVLGGPLPRPVAAHVQRWGGGLPQYAVGHLDAVAQIRDEIAAVAGLEVAGAAYEGVGIAACISSGRQAARSVATHLLARAGRLRE